MSSAGGQAEEWLPHMLDPTPLELLDLIGCSNGLAAAVRQYEEHLAGQPLEVVCRGTRFKPLAAQVWRNLLDVLALLGAWNTGDEPLAFDSSGDFFADIAGWTDPETIEDNVAVIQDVYSEIIQTLESDDLIGAPPALLELAMRWEAAQNGGTFVWYTRETFEWIADDMARSPGEGRAVASTMQRDAAEIIVSAPDYDVERIRDIGWDWRQWGGVCYEAILVSQQRERLVSESTLPTDLPEEYRGFERQVVAGEVFPSLTPERAIAEDTAPDLLECAADMMRSAFDAFCTKTVPDAHGKRTLNISPEELPRYTGYSRLEGRADKYPRSVYRGNPFARTLEIEALTGTRLAAGNSPLWFIYLFERYKRVCEREGPVASFREYATRRFPHSVTLADGPSPSPGAQAKPWGTGQACPDTAALAAEWPAGADDTAHAFPDGMDSDAYSQQLSELESELRSISPGRADAYRYEKWVGEVIRLCFFRDLVDPQPHQPTYETDIVRDWIAANRASTPFWRMVRQKWNADQVVWECKNKTDLDADAFRQISDYLNQHIGRFGIIAYRGQFQRSYWPHLRRRLIDDKFVLLLNDDDFRAFLAGARTDETANRHMQRRHNEFLRKLA